MTVIFLFLILFLVWIICVILFSSKSNDRKSISTSRYSSDKPYLPQKTAGTRSKPAPTRSPPTTRPVAPEPSFAQEAEKWALEGKTKLENLDYVGAIRCFEKAITLDPNNAVCRNHLEFAKRLSQQQTKTVPPVPTQQPKPAVPQTPPAPILVQYKPDWQKIKELIIKNNIKLFHFTDEANIESIKLKDGLYSWYYLEQNNITIAKPGGNSVSRDLDAKKGLQDYVRLSFCKDHPMMYHAKNHGRINNPIILEIDPSVLLLQDTIFSNMNAADNEVQLGKDHTFLKESINYSLFGKRYFDLSGYDKKYYQAEVLVLKCVPIGLIININQYSKK